MSVLKKIDQSELAARKKLAEEAFRARKSGYDAFASSDPATGRPIGGYIAGGVEAFLAPSSLDILPVYLEKVEQGFILHELGVVSLNHLAHEIYFYKPSVVIKEELKAILQEVEDAYVAEIEAHNNAVIEKEIAAQIRLEDAKAAKAAADAAKAQRERIAAEVRSALGADKP